MHHPYTWLSFEFNIDNQLQLDIIRDGLETLLCMNKDEIDCAVALHGKLNAENHAEFHAPSSMALYNEIKEYAENVLTIQKLQNLVDASIPLASHSHPTIVPLTIPNDHQAVIFETVVEFMFDFINDTAMEDVDNDITNRTELYEAVDRIVAAATLLERWKHVKK